MSSAINSINKGSLPTFSSKDLYMGHIAWEGAVVRLQWAVSLEHYL